MDYVKFLKEYKKEYDLTNIQLEELLGKSSSQISQYMHKKAEMPDEVKEKISYIAQNEQELLEKIPPKFKPEVEKVSVNEASQRLGVGTRILQLGLQQEKFPFGLAIKGNGNSFSYVIFRGEFERYLKQVK